MVTRSFQRTANVFGAIADPTRRAILDLLMHKERSAGELAEAFAVSRPAISRHVRVLRAARLVRERRIATQRWYALDAGGLAEVDAWLSRYRLFWAARLQALRQFVESGAASTTPAGPETPTAAEPAATTRRRTRPRRRRTTP
jgi:DNA-binding transcriptional ArsR family regulator